MVHRSSCGFYVLRLILFISLVAAFVCNIFALKYVIRVANQTRLNSKNANATAPTTVNDDLSQNSTNLNVENSVDASLNNTESKSEEENNVKQKPGLKKEIENNSKLKLNFHSFKAIKTNL